MPREGYVDITISREAHEILQRMKEELNVNSYNEVILRMWKAIKLHKVLLTVMYNRRTIKLPPSTELFIV